MLNITRRTALAVPVTLPLLPVAAYATPANATDDAWTAREAALGRITDHKGEMADETIDALFAPVDEAEQAILSAKAATLTDVERKLAIISGWNGWHEIQPQTIDALLADVRSLMGVAS